MALYQMKCHCGAVIEATPGDAGRTVTCWACLSAVRVPTYSFSAASNTPSSPTVVPTGGNGRFFQFSLRTLLIAVGVVACILSLPRQPFFASIILVAMLLTARLPRPLLKDDLSILAYDCMIGMTIGLALATINLTSSVTSDDRAAQATLRLITGPVIGFIWGGMLAVNRWMS